MTAVPIPAKMGEPVMMMSTPTAVSVLQVTQGKTVKQTLMNAVLMPVRMGELV